MLVEPDPSYTSANHHKYTTKNRLYQWHLQTVLNSIYTMLETTAPRTVLDAGCGEGFVAAYLLRRNPQLRITGLDVSEGALAYARAHVDEAVTFRSGSLYKLPFSDNSFDTVLCSEVLEHVDDPDRAVRELKRVTRRHALLTVPYEPYFQKLNMLGQRLGLSPDPGHVNFWTKKGFQAFVRAHFDEATFAWKHLYQLAVCRIP